MASLPQKPKLSHAKKTSVVTTRSVENGDTDIMRPAGGRKREMRKFWGGRSSGFELDPRPSHNMDDPLVCRLSYRIVVLVAYNEQLLMIATELATMEEGNRIRIITIDDGYSLHPQNSLCDDKLCHRHSVQQFIHGNHGLYRHPFHYRRLLFTGKHHAFGGHWKKDYLHHVRISDVDWRALEYTRILNLQLVYGN